jgi:hypothetical protein
VLGAVDDALEAMRVEHARQVDEGAGDGGDRQALVRGDVARPDGAASMDANARGRMGTAQGRHVELRW